MVDAHRAAVEVNRIVARRNSHRARLGLTGGGATSSSVFGALHSIIRPHRFRSGSPGLAPADRDRDLCPEAEPRPKLRRSPLPSRPCPRAGRGRGRRARKCLSPGEAPKAGAAAPSSSAFSSSRSGSCSWPTISSTIPSFHFSKEPPRGLLAAPPVWGAFVYQRLRIRAEGNLRSCPGAFILFGLS
jgi:hypothetical protein